jgi:hypothetical protein
MIMNKMLFLAMLLTPTLAFAQTAVTTAPVAATTQQKPVDFTHRKAKIVERLDKRSTELQKRQQCVQAAGTNDALDACFPKHKERTK